MKFHLLYYILCIFNEGQPRFGATTEHVLRCKERKNRTTFHRRLTCTRRTQINDKPFRKWWLLWPKCSQSLQKLTCTAHVSVHPHVLVNSKRSHLLLLTRYDKSVSIHIIAKLKLEALPVSFPSLWFLI